MEEVTKLGYVEFKENLIRLSGFSESFLEINDTFVKDISEFLWEDYTQNNQFITHYAKLLSVFIKIACSYGVDCE